MKFGLSGAELNNLLKSCPNLTRLELEYVALEEDHGHTGDLMTHDKQLWELVLAKTKLMEWFCGIFSGMDTLELKRGLDPTKPLITDNRR